MVLAITERRGPGHNTSAAQGVLWEAERTLEREEISDQFQDEGKPFYGRDYSEIINCGRLH